MLRHISSMITVSLLLLHSKELEITAGSWSLTTADGASSIGFDGDPWLFPQNQYLVVPLQESLVADQLYIFTIGFKAPLEDGLVGLYRSSYTGSDGQRK